MSSLCSSDPTWWRNKRIKEGQSSPALQPFLFTMDITHMRAIEVICISQMLAVIQCTEPSDNCPPHIMKCLCLCSLDQTMLDNLTVKMLSFFARSQPIVLLHTSKGTSKFLYCLQVQELQILVLFHVFPIPKPGFCCHWTGCHGCMLANLSTYKPVTKDPTAAIQRCINTLLLSLKHSNHMSHNTLPWQSCFIE